MERILNLNKKAIVVTGATSGLGFETSAKLYQMGAHIIGVGRNEERCRVAKEKLMALKGSGEVDYVLADLSSLQQIDQLAKSIGNILGEGSLHALVNNAGAFSSYLSLTPEGHELQFAVNHLAPYYLTHHLMPYLQKAEDGRVVTVSSGSHYHARIHFKDVHLRRTYNPLTAYKQSKLANVMFTYDLNRRGLIPAYAADPGLVNTDIGLKQATGIANLVWRLRQRHGAPASKGCLTSVHLASKPNSTLQPHIYYRDCQPKVQDKYATRAMECNRLWALSAKMCGIKEDGYGMLSKDQTKGEYHAG